MHQDRPPAAAARGEAGACHAAIPRRATNSARSRSVLAWTLQVVLAVLMTGGGVAKLMGDDAMVELFSDIGAGQWLRLLTGGLELLGGLGLLVPRLRAFAAVGVLVLLLAAALVNVTVLGLSPLAPLGCAAVALAIALLRRQELK